MNNETLRLQLIETFAKNTPIIVEPNDAIYQEFEDNLFSTIASDLKNAIEDDAPVIRILSSSISYKTKQHIPYRFHEKHWSAYVPRLRNKLISIGVPFVLSTHFSRNTTGEKYERSEFTFRVEELKKFCDAEKMGLLI